MSEAFSKFIIILAVFFFITQIPRVIRQDYAEYRQTRQNADYGATVYYAR